MPAGGHPRERLLQQGAKALSGAELFDKLVRREFEQAGVPLADAETGDEGHKKSEAGSKTTAKAKK